MFIYVKDRLDRPALLRVIRVFGTGLRGLRTQFYVDLIYGVAFILGFAYLMVVEMDPRVATFQGGLVLGYFLHVWEKMEAYERILQEEVSSEAEKQVSSEVDEQLQERVEDEIDEQMGEVGNRIEKEVSREVGDVDRKIEREVSEEVEEVGDRLDEISREVDERIDEISEEVEELENGG